MRQSLLILAFWFLLASPLSATSYFVTQSGAGSQNGLSLANAWSVATYNASGVPTGGDTVFFSGTITSGVVTSTNGTGNGASRLTLNFTGSCGGCNPAAFGTLDPVIDLNNKSFVTFQGSSSTSFTSTGNPTVFEGNNRTGHDITIDGFTYTGPVGGKPDFFLGGQYNNVTLTNNTVDNVSHFVNAALP